MTEFRNLTAKRGKRSNREECGNGKVYYVWTIAVDNDNVRWFGTFNRGGYSFDGTEWKIHNKDSG